MQSLEENRKGISINVAVLTVSDSRTIENDKSGKYLIKSVEEEGHKCIERNIIIDDVNKIIKVLRKWIDDKGIDVIIITGGTGITGRDVTPEAIDKIKDKYIPGFGEVFRYISYKKIGSSSIQSRAIACVSKGTFIFSLPGSPGACKDAWEGIIKMQLDSRNKPCNLIELMPRLLEK
ncbi:MAG: molybdenum cofactor biosynthesis protein B [Pelagibacterales bacterium]|nr:molybdenum cofactor biosynthesis protein B [Pelagibacterales bacterium]OUU63338.1 MAG: molybdenum cofactor biosynthesis protein B [Alphaproteobacteria bacterium TMED62]|tara:strand:+ start:3082 stop:3612 length:531 start_codon:yes stop_codon:yes gene_type:complete